MAKTIGWTIFLWILAIIVAIQIIVNFVNSVGRTQGQLTAAIVFGVIIYLLFKKYDLKK
jgi:hypothetical protein